MQRNSRRLEREQGLPEILLLVFERVVELFGDAS